MNYGMEVLELRPQQRNAYWDGVLYTHDDNDSSLEILPTGGYHLALCSWRWVILYE